VPGAAARIASRATEPAIPVGFDLQADQVDGTKVLINNTFSARAGSRSIKDPRVPHKGAPIRRAILWLWLSEAWPHRTDDHARWYCDVH
jgi:hypothetical protein